MHNTTEEMQVCFVTTTQYQFMIADIYSRYVYDMYGIKPVVLIRKFRSFDISKFSADNKYMLVPYTINNRNIFGQCVFAFKCGYLFKLTSWSKILNKDKRILLFVFNDLSKLTDRLMSETKKLNKQNKIVLIEEGNNTYSDIPENPPELLWKFKHMLSRLFLGMGRSSAVIGESQNIEAAIVKDTNRYQMLKKAENQEIIQQNRSILQNSNEFLEHYSNACNEKTECDVLFLGQPFYKNGKYYTEENNCISAIIDSFSLNTKILIKPHPRDCADKYDSIQKSHSNVSVIKEDMAVFPIEALIGLINIKAVVTIESSAAVTVADLDSSVDAIVLINTPEAKKLLGKLKLIGEELPALDENSFVGKNNNVYLASNLAECKEIVAKHKYEKKNEGIDDKKKHSIPINKFEEMDVFFNTEIGKTQ